jgi:hypothetical protein
VVTVAVSIASEMMVRTGGGNWAVTNGTSVIQTLFSSIGVKLPAFFGAVPYLFMILWFHPFALRLGWQRAAIWIALIGVGTAVGFSFGSGARLAAFLILLFPCMAMIGRRSRPWMAFPAAGATVAAFELSSDLVGTLFAIVPFAAILIFGTDLIPKKPAMEATTA